jgi:hypothetical protein
MQNVSEKVIIPIQHKNNSSVKIDIRTIFLLILHVQKAYPVCSSHSGRLRGMSLLSQLGHDYTVTCLMLRIIHIHLRPSSGFACFRLGRHVDGYTLHHTQNLLKEQSHRNQYFLFFFAFLWLESFIETSPETVYWELHRCLVPGPPPHFCQHQNMYTYAYAFMGLSSIL